MYSQQRDGDIAIAWIPGQSRAGADDRGSEEGGPGDGRRTTCLASTCATSVACTASTTYKSTGMHREIAGQCGKTRPCKTEGQSNLPNGEELHHRDRVPKKQRTTKHTVAITAAAAAAVSTILCKHKLMMPCMRAGRPDNKSTASVLQSCILKLLEVNPFPSMPSCQKLTPPLTDCGSGIELTSPKPPRYVLDAAPTVPPPPPPPRPPPFPPLPTQYWSRTEGALLPVQFLDVTRWKADGGHE